MRRRYSKRVYHCVRQTTKKYTQRHSPPYQAQECPGKKMKGNDGNMYISHMANVSGIYRWIPTKTKKNKK